LDKHQQYASILKIALNFMRKLWACASIMRMFHAHNQQLCSIFLKTKTSVFVFTNKGRYSAFGRKCGELAAVLYLPTKTAASTMLRFSARRCFSD
jgi:hypothetical protein